LPGLAEDKVHTAKSPISLRYELASGTYGLPKCALLSVIENNNTMNIIWVN